MSLLFSANDVADKGVLVHARDNSDLAWINHRYYDIYAEHNYYILGLLGENDKFTGTWADEPATYGGYFICEGFI